MKKILKEVEFSNVWSVSDLSRKIGQFCEDSFHPIWVSGELSSITRAVSGHWYFSIKDEAAQLRCVMFRNASQRINFELRMGDKVEIYAIISFYQLRGELQLTVDMIRKKGKGSVFEEFIRIKERLAAEGLFETNRKKSIPRYPSVIGVVTSSQAAALHDVLTTLKRRAPHVRIMHYDAPVQGNGAAEKIAQKINLAVLDNIVDVLILCRGGGSIEDLSIFNNENLARVISSCPIPVVTGIGHELDFTIADFVADFRAPTPTAAAEIASPDYQLVLHQLANIGLRMYENMFRILNEKQQVIDWIARQLQNSLFPLKLSISRLRALQNHLHSLAKNFLQYYFQSMKGIQNKFQMIFLPTDQKRSNLAEVYRYFLYIPDLIISREKSIIELLSQRLNLSNPNELLNRGYAFISQPNGDRLIGYAKNLRHSTSVKIHFIDGSAIAEIKSIELDEK